MAASKELSAFLKAARSRIDPVQVGLRPPLQRRRRGLRREDVAALAGVSVKWYTWLEQGRDINVSDDVLERVCWSLRLSTEERDYLFMLARGRPAQSKEVEERITETLWHTIQFLPAPAMVLTLRWDIVAWNSLIARVFRNYGAIPAQDRNLLKIILTDEEFGDEPSYEKLLRRLIAKFRFDFSQRPDDASIAALIEELREISPTFERLWENAEICGYLRGNNVIQHDELGELRFDHTSYVPEGSPFHRLLMFVPSDAETAAKIASLNPLEAPADSKLNASSRIVDDLMIIRHSNRH